MSKDANCSNKRDAGIIPCNSSKGKKGHLTENVSFDEKEGGRFPMTMGRVKDGNGGAKKG